MKQVLTFIRPGTMPGLLLSMIKELPYNQRSEEYMPLSRVQIYSAEDDSMSLNLFVYGEEPKQLTEADVTVSGEQDLCMISSVFRDNLTSCGLPSLCRISHLGIRAATA